MSESRSSYSSASSKSVGSKYGRGLPGRPPALVALNFIAPIAVVLTFVLVLMGLTDTLFKKNMDGQGAGTILLLALAVLMLAGGEALKLFSFYSGSNQAALAWAGIGCILGGVVLVFVSFFATYDSALRGSVAS